MASRSREPSFAGIWARITATVCGMLVDEQGDDVARVGLRERGEGTGGDIALEVGHDLRGAFLPHGRRQHPPRLR